MPTPIKYGRKVRTWKTYRAWERMWQRVGNKNHPSYVKYYQSRGITVCTRWKKFENFLVDMGECPIKMSLDRIDNDGNYTKSNCRWTTVQEQNWNTSRQYRIFHDDRYWTVRDIATKFGLSHHAVRWRFRVNPTWKYLTMPHSPGKRGLRELP